MPEGDTVHNLAARLRPVLVLLAEGHGRKRIAELLGISPHTLRYKLAQMRDAGMDVEAYLYAS